ncbi:MAG: SRPBCC family protein [Pseudomonadota bacterium]
MAKVSMSMDLGVSADKLWDMIGLFHGLHDWHPAVERTEIEGEGKGSLRTLHLVGGGEIVERLEQLDEEGKKYNYSILSSPLPVANYNSTISVKESDDGSCKVQWESEFNPSGAPENDAVKAIQGVYQAGFDNLKKMFGG